MKKVHSIPVGKLRDLEPEWNTFIRAQMGVWKARHHRLGMPEWLISEGEPMISDRASSLFTNSPIILTGEYAPFNLLVSPNAGAYTLTGMIDFGDVMVGLAEYDFLGPLLFLCEGSRDLVNAFFEGYGSMHVRGDEALTNRLMSLAILHRYSNLQAQIRIPTCVRLAHASIRRA